jgi:acyl-CoA synthetase (AMP-forming)/AMP-acid ligase II
MSTTGSTLQIDGELVTSAHYTALLAESCRRLEQSGLAPGAGIVVCDDSALAVILAAAAIQQLGGTLLLQSSTFPLAPEHLIKRVLVARFALDHAGNPVAESLMGAEQLSFPAGADVIFWTSGSQGQPKAVALSWQALAYQAEATGERLTISEQDRLCVPLPLSHAYGFGLVQLWQHFSCHLLLESRFDPARIMKRLAQEAISSLDGVPSMYALLLTEAKRSRETRQRLSQVRLLNCGGDLLPQALQRDYLAVIGQPLLDGYGLTEAGPNVAISSPECWRLGSVGRRLRGTEVRLEEATGELLVRSPSVMQGYLDDEAATRSSITADGWLHTGDAARIDEEGYIELQGRLKEIIIVHGQTYPPLLIEDVVRQCAGVAEVVVIGVRYKVERGDSILAFVVPQYTSNEKALTTQIRQYCQRDLPAHLRPRLIQILADLPRLRSGKPDRVALRSQAIRMLAGR